MTFTFNVDVLWLFKSKVSDQLLINKSGYLLYRKIGSGSFGNVYITHKLQEKRLYAVKIMKRRDNEATSIASELRLMSMNDAPLVLHQMVDSFPYNSSYWIISELCRGTLGYFINTEKRRKKVESWQVKELILELLSAINYLHSKSWMHGDVKPDNILITNKGRIKLTDFSCSYWFEKDKEKGCKFPKAFGTPAYMAPEINKKQIVNVYSDLYSIGATLYDLMRGCVPNKKYGSKWILQHSKRAKGDNIDEATREYGEFVSHLLNHDYKIRLQASKNFMSNHSQEEINNNNEIPYFTIERKKIGKPLSKKKFITACPEGKFPEETYKVLKKHHATPEDCHRRVSSAREKLLRKHEISIESLENAKTMKKSQETSSKKSQKTNTTTTTTTTSRSNKCLLLQNELDLL